MMELKKGTNNADVVLIGVFGVIVLLNALKPWLDYWTPLHYQVITAFQFLLLTFTVTFLNKSFYKQISFLGAVLLLFILIRFFAETLVDLLEGDILGIVGSLYVVVRVFLLVYLFQILLSSNRHESVYRASKFLLISYFLLTFFYSLMQHPEILDIQMMREAGGNLTSENYWGFFRTNGGIGGTVIDYANFLLAVSWVILFTPSKNKYIKFFLFLVLVCSLILCFSRALFLALFFIFAVYSISIKSIPKLLLSLVFVAISTLYMIINIDPLFELVSSVAGDSDLYRLESWAALFKDFVFIEYFLGKELGGNTGLFIGERYKISGDGFITGTIYDSGILMVVILLGFIANTIFSINCTWRIKFSIMGSLLVMLVINSGFEKLFTVMIYVISIAIIHGMNKKNLSFT